MRLIASLLFLATVWQVAQAQQSVSELVRKLRAKGKQVRFAIHPVAGQTAGAYERPAWQKPASHMIS